MKHGIVLDTNVYISAVKFGGKSKRVLDWVHEGNLQLLVLLPLRLEFERILREKFSFTSRRASALSSVIWQDAEWIAPKHRLMLCPDDADNRVLECAVEGGAAIIVTGDRHLLRMHPVSGISILSPDAFLTHAGIQP